MSSTRTLRRRAAVLGRVVGGVVAVRVVGGRRSSSRRAQRGRRRRSRCRRIAVAPPPLPGTAARPAALKTKLSIYTHLFIYSIGNFTLYFSSFPRQDVNIRRKYPK